jgi:hypothetical protein
MAHEKQAAKTACRTSVRDRCHTIGSSQTSPFPAKGRFIHAGSSTSLPSSPSRPPHCSAGREPSNHSSDGGEGGICPSCTDGGRLDRDQLGDRALRPATLLSRPTAPSALARRKSPLRPRHRRFATIAPPTGCPPRRPSPPHHSGTPPLRGLARQRRTRGSAGRWPSTRRGNGSKNGSPSPQPWRKDFGDLGSPMANLRGVGLNSTPKEGAAPLPCPARGKDRLRALLEAALFAAPEPLRLSALVRARARSPSIMRNSSNCSPTCPHPPRFRGRPSKRPPRLRSNSPSPRRKSKPCAVSATATPSGPYLSEPIAPGRPRPDPQPSAPLSAHGEI